ncbi:hypothetical protein J4437_00520 [Candidatus Woesearchaeota archaeon]|nr:hypothetical protein [Candidatus Woesearchaeota archaeon]
MTQTNKLETKQRPTAEEVKEKEAEVRALFDLIAKDRQCVQNIASDYQGNNEHFTTKAFDNPELLYSERRMFGYNGFTAVSNLLSLKLPSGSLYLAVHTLHRMYTSDAKQIHNEKYERTLEMKRKHHHNPQFVFLNRQDEEFINSYVLNKSPISIVRDFRLFLGRPFQSIEVFPEWKNTQSDSNHYDWGLRENHSVIQAREVHRDKVSLFLQQFTVNLRAERKLLTTIENTRSSSFFEYGDPGYKIHFPYAEESILYRIMGIAQP